jgi:uncharacterized membrane protein
MANGHQLALYLGFGILSSVLMAVGLLMIKSRAESLPIATGHNLARALLAWIRDPIWIGGLGVETAGYALYVIALAGAPVSMMAVAMQGGIALFVLFAVIFLGERARPWEWLGIAAFLTAALLLASSLNDGAVEGTLNTHLLAEASVAAVAVAISPLLVARARHSGIAFAIASGIAFGMGCLYTKALADDLTGAAGFVALAQAMFECPYTCLIIVANIAGLVLLQNAFALGRGIIAMPLSSAFSSTIPIIGGVVAFGERLPANPHGAATRLGAFVLTIAAAMALAAGDLGAKQP